MAESFVDVKDTVIQTFGDGFEEETVAFGRAVFKIPRMEDVSKAVKVGIEKSQKPRPS